ncbi:unnamed protein product [Dibothriocephalus latus]|uniref:Uncharacterized protein n=1 Tax=Dibothriocephalus latus TaxID=60516 RepID=A0A3P6TLB7_DIBLA|nr:unnamed protein product [Dibothriocephalus latus]
MKSNNEVCIFWVIIGVLGTLLPIGFGNSQYVDPIYYRPPCPEENYDLDNETGNFRCAVPTAAECFELCQELGCNEWSFLSFVSSTSTEKLEHRRCRCVPEFNYCMYTFIPSKLRLYT